MDDLVRFVLHPQSGIWPVVQHWVADDCGGGGYAWVRTPADILELIADSSAMEQLRALGDRIATI